MEKATAPIRTRQEPAKAFAARSRDRQASPSRRPSRESARPLLETSDAVALLAGGAAAGGVIQRQPLATGYSDIVDAARTSGAPGYRVSHPSDRLEREADRVADHVMSQRPGPVTVSHA